MTTATDHADVLERVQALRHELRGLTTMADQADRPVSTGCEAFDRWLPHQGFSWGSLVELLAEGRGSGAGWLAMHVAGQAMTQQQGCLVVTDRKRRFYPPACIAQGIDPQKLIVVRPGSAAEELWAMDQALRCPGVSAVLAWIDHLDSLAFRRLQLAAETGQTLGLLMRPATVQHQPSWSEIQLLVDPIQGSGGDTRSRQDGRQHEREDFVRVGKTNRHCRVTLLRQRGRAATLEGSSLELEFDTEAGGGSRGVLKEVVRRHHETRHLHLAPRVAPSTTRRRSAGA